MRDGDSSQDAADPSRLMDSMEVPQVESGGTNGVRAASSLLESPKRRKSLLSLIRKKDVSGRRFSSSSAVSGTLSYSHLPNTSAVHKRLAAAPSIEDHNLLWLASLPQELREVLCRYDTNGDGLLDMKEIEHAAEDLTRMRQIVEEGKIPMSSFPPSVREMLEEHDKNGDGELDVVEIIHGFEALARERRLKQLLTWFSIGTVFFSIVLLICIGGLMAYVIDVTKDTTVDGHNMVVKGSAELVRTAAAEFTVKEGVMVQRDAACSAEDASCDRPLRTAQNSQRGRLSSVLPDEDLDELRSLRITGGSAWVHFSVLAVARVEAAGSRHGSVVVLWTPLGKLRLDGEDLAFGAEMEAEFAEAGFQLDPVPAGSRRRLLGVITTIGVFNSLRTLLGEDTPSDLGTDAEGILRSRFFEGKVTRMEVCGEGEPQCRVDGGGVADHAQATGRGGGEVALVTEEEQEFREFGGEVVARSEARYGQYPHQTRTEVWNASHVLAYQSFQGRKYRCQVKPSVELRAAAEGAAETVAAGGSSGSGEVAVEGPWWETVGGVRCRVWRVRGGGAELFYFEHYQEQRVYQLNVSNALVLRFPSLAPVAPAAGPVPEHLSIEALLATCEPPALRVPPLPWLPGRVTHRQHPRPNWGQPVDAGGRREGGGAEEEPEPEEVSREAYLQRKGTRFFEGSPAEHAEWLAANPGEQPREWCFAGAGAGNASEVVVSYRSYAPCSGERREGASASEATLTVAEESSCLSGGGSISILREGPYAATVTGGVTLTADILKCFEHQIPGWRGKCVSRLEEDELYCELGAQRQLGGFGASRFNATTVTYLEEPFYSSLGRLLFHMSATLKVQTVAYAQDECGSAQADRALHVGFRQSFELCGSIAWNLCCANSQCAPCVPPATSWIEPVEFCIHRSLWPGTSRTDAEDNLYGYCQTDDQGTYRFACDGDDCNDPIGFVKLGEGLTCT